MKFTILTLALSGSLAFAGTLPPASTPGSVPPPPVSSKPANSFNYNYLGLGWIHNEVDASGAGNGYYAGLSLSPANNLILFANWDQTWGDDNDYRNFDIGVGGYLPLSSRADIVLKAGFGWNDAEILETQTNDANTFVTSLGFRIALTDWLELAPAYVLDVADGDAVHSGVASLLFNIGTDVKLSINGSISDEESSFGAGLRYEF